MIWIWYWCRRRATSGLVLSSIINSSTIPKGCWQCAMRIGGSLGMNLFRARVGQSAPPGSWRGGELDAGSLKRVETSGEIKICSSFWMNFQRNSEKLFFSRPLRKFIQNGEQSLPYRRIVTEWIGQGEASWVAGSEAALFERHLHHLRRPQVSFLSSAPVF